MVECNKDIFCLFSSEDMDIDIFEQNLTTNCFNSLTNQNNNSTISDNDSECGEEAEDKREVGKREDQLLITKRQKPISINESLIKTSHSFNVNTGLWNKRECFLFAQGLLIYGTQWKKFNHIISSRTVPQIRSHAQKFFEFLRREIKYSDNTSVTNENICKFFSNYLKEEIKPSTHFYNAMRAVLFKDNQANDVINQRHTNNNIKNNVNSKYFLITKVAKINKY